MAGGYCTVDKMNFEHIKRGWPCSLTYQEIAGVRQSIEGHFNINQDNISPRLAQILDEHHGTEEIVYIRRKALSVERYIQCDDHAFVFKGGSVGDGFSMICSDNDQMEIVKNVVVTHPDQVHRLPRHSADKTILLMRPDGCRPGYVKLQVAKIANGEGKHSLFQNAIVPVGDLLLLSSDIYRQGHVDFLTASVSGVVYVSNGPCRTNAHDGHSYDCAYAFPCVCWPKEANEWIYRTRLHGWPTQALIHRIVEAGCHVVPVGDKCSTDTLLQWRISFACAEQLLIHSLTHPQFRVYGLLKYFLFQIKELLEHIIGDDDILCSYFLKTVIFFAVENSPHLLWDGNHTFVCFRFCLSILIAWVRTGHCPNYFIRDNNMFLRKVHGEARHKLLHLLTDLYHLNWVGLSLGTDFESYIGCYVQLGPLCSKLRSECIRDIVLFATMSHGMSGHKHNSLYKSLKCLHAAHTDIDIFITYRAVVRLLYYVVVELLNEYQNARGNKQKFMILRKCNNISKVVSQVSGLLPLASFHYLTGNYSKALRVCREMMSSFRIFIDERFALIDDRYFEPYERLYCGKEYTLWQKFKEGVYFSVYFNKENIMLCPPHLHMEVTKMLEVDIPPLSYAIFLSFLCYRELGDLRKRDTELVNLRAANDDPYQGGHKFWIVHTILGICYQTVGDKRRAIGSFRDSLRVKPDGNPAKERIEALRSSR
ncbi:uncharacterized protein LOC117343006 [Pecten maximus]|uniref:uncharacterized protein LOC117343006 n=1 Tax=Pecten maximus TaxID=6579 RepID=UPI0014590C16|nr:uncharacterized protein LOC117343006 [Pecten maximus]